MHMILCHPGDHAAIWLHGAMRATGLPDAQIVSVEQLVYSRSIVHRMDSTADAGEIRLADGRAVRADSITGLVNRFRYLPSDHFAAATPDDRRYATDELHAFMLAWLDAVPGLVVNRAHPGALGGDSFGPLLLHQQAAAVGLPIAGTLRSSRAHAVTEASPPAVRSAIVFGHRVFGPVLPRPIQDGCRRLAVALGVPLLQVDFAREPAGGLSFAGASGSVDFRIGGRALASAMASAFNSGSLQ